jgi:membrane-bound lytic murein transglycosylase D
MFKVKLATSAVVFALVILTGVAAPHASGNPFPVPEVIAPNVEFWTKVYARYTTGQGIIHDSADLELIYDVIDLIPYDVPDPGQTNRARIKAAVAEYESILRRLAREPDTADEKCRRVAALFKEPLTSERLHTAAARLRCQIGQKDRFQAGLIRSGAFIEQIRNILRANGLPEDLAYLPHVESSFNPHAYSKVGAAGMWQFTRSTGQRFMEVGYAIDERRDPLLSSYAAAALLKENYARLGNWPLALTAYNHGANGMQRAKNLHGDDFAIIYQYYSSPSFKFASRNFYAEFLAARQVAANYQEYFGELEFDRPVPTKHFVLDGFASFRDLSRHFKVDPEVLKQMNPALRQPVFSGQKHVPHGYALRLPAQVDDTLLAASMPNMYRQMQVPSRFYTVQKGDTASKIARTHGIHVNELIAANQLDRNATIRPKQNLRIPGADEQIQTASAVPASKSISKEIARADASPAPKTAESVKTTSPQPQRTEAPQAQKYPQPVLASIIPLPAVETPAYLFEQPAAETQVRSEQIVTADVRFERVYEHKGRRVGILQVEVEENLGRYATWAGVRVQQIRELNAMGANSVLRLHRKLKIPLHRVSPETFEQHRYEYHKRLQEDFFEVYRIGGDMQVYQVRKGDTYWSLCQGKFQIPLWLLKHVNPEANLADLTAGMKLMIPSIERASSMDADPGVESEFDVEEIEPLPIEASDEDPII